MESRLKGLCKEEPDEDDKGAKVKHEVKRIQRGDDKDDKTREMGPSRKDKWKEARVLVGSRKKKKGFVVGGRTLDAS